MINEIIELLPSAELKAKIKETNHQFKETELVEIIYRYAPTFDKRIDMLEEFHHTASPDASALTKAYIEYERETFARFIEPSDVFVYELCIKLEPDSFESHYICASYNAALACIDRYLEEYADLDFKETELTRYKIKKQRVFSEDDKFNDDTPAECVLGPQKTVLTVSDYQYYFEDFCSDKGISVSTDDIRFPCFVQHRALVKYRDIEEKEHFGICLCWMNKINCDGLTDHYFVISLDSPTIREHRFNSDDHDHIEAPKISLASPTELDAIMRKNYFDYLVFLDTEQEAKIQRMRKGIAICEECGSEYLASRSKMNSLCPECAHILYGYENCNHVFEDGKCTLCLWDGNRSDYIKEILKKH